MNAVKIKEGIYWVGGIDWDLRNFHGYLTQRGSTYNAYLIIDEKVTLIDTTKAHLTDEMIERISSVWDVTKIDYIISNHVEMDHSGGLPKILELNPNATLITSPNGEKGIREHYNKDWNFRPLKSEETINLGKRNLVFELTPMVHWPDNMICYMPEEKILFSNDGFGQHYSSSERFDDECGFDIIMDEAKKYYANIVLPYGPQVQKEIEAASKYDIKMICPSHGVIWRKDTNKIIDAYTRWANNELSKKAIIIYDTMWNSTKSIAYTIEDAFSEKGYKTVMCSLQNNHISDIMTLLMDAEYICVGSPTLNNTMLPTVSAFLTYLKGLAPSDRKAIAFGSYGWGGQSIKEVADVLENDCKFELIDRIKAKYVPTKEVLESIKQNIIEKI